MKFTVVRGPKVGVKIKSLTYKKDSLGNIKVLTYTVNTEPLETKVSSLKGIRF